MNVSTLYDGNGVAQFPGTPLVVSVAGAPTGTVFNGSAGFVVNDGNGHSGSAVFMFATEGGTIRGWNPSVPPPPRVDPVVRRPIRRPSGAGAVFKGLAIAGRPALRDRLPQRRRSTSSTRASISTPAAFVDPKLPKGYAPFGIQNVGGNIFVTYAKRTPTADDEVPARASVSSTSTRPQAP